MGKLGKLKRERDKLIAQREARREMTKIIQEKKKLKLEIRKEKYPALYGAKEHFVGVAKKARGYATKKSIKYITRKAKRLKPRPIKQSKARRIPSPKNLNQAMYGGY